MAYLGPLTRQFPPGERTSVMFAIKQEQNMSEEELSSVSSNLASSMEGNTALGKSHGNCGEPITFGMKQQAMTSDWTNLTQPSELGVSGAEEMSTIASDYTMMHERLHGSFSHQVAEDSQTPPYLGCPVVINSNLHQRWRQTGIDLDLHSDTKIAAFLLNQNQGEKGGKMDLMLVCHEIWYEESRAKTSGTNHLCSSCHTPLTLVCLTCNPVQTKHEEATMPPLVYYESDNSDLHGEDDSGDNIPLTIDLSDGDLLKTDSVSTADYTSQEKNTDNSTKALPSTFNQACIPDKDLLKNFTLSQSVDHRISETCFVKVLDIACKQTVKRLQKEKLVSAAEEEKLKNSKRKNIKSAAVHRKTEVKNGEVSYTGSIKNAEQAVLHMQSTDAVEQTTVKKKRGRPRKEHHAHISETGDVNEKPYKCSLCGRAFKLRSNCRSHELIHTGKGKPHKCEQCPAAFRSQANLKAHCRKHTGERPFCCETCGKAFARSTTLEQHKRIHTNDRPYKCEECGERFKQRGMVIVHRRKVHTFERPFSCNICGASFVVKGHLQVHMQSHTGLRPFLCEECGASFKQKGILETHKMIHKGIRPFSCDICSKAFYRQVDVRSHKKMHSNIRNVICTVCGAAFGSNSTLKRHMQKHTGFRPFKCSECGKNFASNSELKVHLRIHSGVKPYVCDLCDRGFQTMGNMKKHRNNRHKYAPPYVSSTPKTSAQGLEDQDVRSIVSALPKTDLLLSGSHKTRLLVSEEQNTLLVSAIAHHEKGASPDRGEQLLTSVNGRENLLSLSAHRI